MFVLCVVAVLYAYILKNRDKMKMTASGLLGPADKASPKTLFGIESFFAKVFDPCIVITAFFIGLFHMTNYWDYPIYFVVAGAVILYVNFVSEGARYTGIVLTVFHAAVVIIISKFVCLPFTISFNQIASEIMPVDTRTPLYQFLVLWGFPFLLGIVFIAVVIKGFGKRRAVITEPIPDNDDKHSKAKAGKKIGNTSNAAFVRFLTQTDPCDIFIMILVLCAMGLCLIPEVIYVKDIYSGDFRRANTMFKITYQAFLIFGTSFGFILARFLIFGKKHTRVFGAIALCLLLLSAGYVKVASDSWYTTETRTYTGLSSDEFLETVDNDEYEAILFLDDYAKGRPVIIEANGDSYSDSCRFSAWTGLPTLLGWKTHEWLWRSSGDEGYPSILTERSEAINDFYTADSLEVMRDVTEKYDISFVIIGKIERTKFGEELNEQLLSELGKTVFSNETVSIIEVAQ